MLRTQVPKLLAEEIVDGRFKPETVEAIPVDGHKALRLRADGRTVFVVGSEAVKLASYLRRDKPDIADLIEALLPEIS